MIGKIISHYKILEKLGEGGMGVVYKAEDTKLKRTVALKFLPPELTRDPEAKKRFVQEAQSASALDHANICTVYEIDETDNGQLFIVMAYYDGETLKDKIARGPLTIEGATEITTQVAKGLSKAHAKGIIHRDIKPANVLITEDNEVKIIDFGLARLSGQSRLTKTHTTLGTTAYMSPEQTRGEEVDHRTDIWSLGVVLYEMLTGELPFKGDYEQAVMYAILHEQPTPLNELRIELPAELQRIVFKCLEKQAENRYQSAEHLLADLQKLKKDIESDTGCSVMHKAAVPTQRKALTRILLVALTGVVFVLIALFALKFGGLFKPYKTVPHLTNPKQITSAIGVEDHPTWSPDGGRLAYDSNQNGNWDIWVKQVNGGEPVNLTVDHSGDDRLPSWSPDGNQIAFWSDRDGGGIYVMPAIGGTLRKVMTQKPGLVFVPNLIRWSEDGTRLTNVVADSIGNYFAEIVTLHTYETQRIRLPGAQKGRLILNWSADERTIAYVDAINVYPSTQSANLYLLRIADGVNWQVTDWLHYDFYPSWSSDGRALYFISNRGGTMDLWQIALDKDGKPGGDPMPLTAGIGLRSAVFSPEGKQLAYSKGRKVANVWRVSVPGPGESPKTWADAQKMTSDNAFIENLKISLDGKRIYFDSDRAGNQDLWAMQIAGGELSRLTINPAADFAPMLSPDGHEIAFYLYRSGNRDIWIMPLGGGPARQISKHPSEDIRPRWSPDGSEIAFESQRNGNFDIWVIPAQGGEAKQLTTSLEEDYWSLWWPDGQWLSFISNNHEEGVSRIWKVSLPDGRLESLTESAPGNLGGPLRWSTENKHIYFKRFIENEGNIWSVSVEEGSEQLLTVLQGRSGNLGLFALTTDSEYLYFTWEEDFGDIWVMDVE